MADFSYPHPVLREVAVGDPDVAGYYQPQLRAVVVDRSTVRLHVDGLTVSNTSVQGMLADGKATQTVEIRCPRTYFHLSQSVTAADMVIAIRSDELEGQVSVSFRIQANQPILWSPHGLHKDYGDACFSLVAGDLLAVGEKTFRFEVPKDGYDPLRTPAASIMQIVRGKTKLGPLQVRLDEDKIQLVLSVHDHDLYAGIKQRAPLALTPTLALPALMYAISAMREEPDEYGDLLWCKRLELIMDHYEVRTASVFEAAQAILDAPHRRAFEQMLQDNGQE